LTSQNYHIKEISNEVLRIENFSDAFISAGCVSKETASFVPKDFRAVGPNTWKRRGWGNHPEHM
jgi:hypothetical protein